MCSPPSLKPYTAMTEGSAIIKVPIIIEIKPINAFLVRCSLKASRENTIVTIMLSLSIGTTTLAGPFCSAL